MDQAKDLRQGRQQTSPPRPKRYGARDNVSLNSISVRNITAFSIYPSSPPCRLTCVPSKEIPGISQRETKANCLRSAAAHLLHNRNILQKYNDSLEIHLPYPPEKHSSCSIVH